jgi:hypothetical protein
LDEIYDRYYRGLPLNFRQSVWLDATSDFTSRGPVDLQVRMPNKNDSVLLNESDADLSVRKAWPYLCHRRVLGCANITHCSDCRIRYKNVEFLSPSDPRNLMKPTELASLRHESYRDFLRQIQTAFAADEDDPFWADSGSNDTENSADDAQRLFDARSTVLRRAGSAKHVSDEQLREALAVLNPHRRRPYSRKELTQEITRIRKRLMRAPAAAAALDVGDVLEARVARVREFGAVVSFPGLEADGIGRGLCGLLHISQARPAARTLNGIFLPGKPVAVARPKIGTTTAQQAIVGLRLFSRDIL